MPATVQPPTHIFVCGLHDYPAVTQGEGCMTCPANTHFYWPCAWRNLVRGSPNGPEKVFAISRGTYQSVGRWQRAVIVFLAALLLIFILSQCTSDSRLTGYLPIEAPMVANAGDQIAITIGPVVVDNGTPVGLVMLGTYGPRVYRTEFQSGLAYFTIPAEHTLQPGYLALIVAAEEARGEASIILFSTEASTIHYVPRSVPDNGAAAQLSTK
ncbi:hypothetical protein HC928_23790 [bacterium]|nr:hypothetical protein [bacterium]